MKPLIYCLIASGGVIISTHFREEQVKKYIIIITLASIFFSTFVFFPNLYNLVDIYKGRPSYDDFNIHFYRFSGFMGYPGPFGYWLVFVSLIVVQSFYRKEISFFKFTILYLFLILSIILTGSRGAIVIFALSTIFFTLMNMFFKRNLVFLIMFFLLSLSLLLILKREIQDIEAIKYLVKDVNNIMGSTFAYRFNEIVMVIENFEKGNFFGLGPNNAWFLDNGMPVETAYFFYGYKFGIFGLMFYFSLIFLNFLLFVFSEKHSFSKLFALWSLVILIIGPLSESITEEYKSFYMYFTLLGYCSGNISKNRKKIPM
ncbi:MAG: hypothetical protein N2Z20_00185 [Elusimicrobiales bacterium]|nr:hypothetical protein [Elusimicrobiales bacterium]